MTTSTEVETETETIVSFLTWLYNERRMMVCEKTGGLTGALLPVSDIREVLEDYACR